MKIDIEDITNGKIDGQQIWVCDFRFSDYGNKMLKRVATDIWIAAKGNEEGFKEWYAKRCKLNVNSNDR